MEIIKNLINIADMLRKSDNLELYKRLIDDVGKIQELLEENEKLRKEIQNFKFNKEIANRIIRQNSTYIKLKDDVANICYCSCCWDVNNKLVQMRLKEDDGTFLCHVCNNHGVYDNAKYELMKRRFDNINPVII